MIKHNLQDQQLNPSSAGQSEIHGENIINKTNLLKFIFFCFILCMLKGVKKDRKIITKHFLDKKDTL